MNKLHFGPSQSTGQGQGRYVIISRSNGLCVGVCVVGLVGYVGGQSYLS